MTRKQSRGALLTLLGTLVVAAIAPPLGAQQQPAPGKRRLSLDEALRMAQMQSEAVQIAGAGLTRAQGQQSQSRSQYLPQLSATAGYTRTLRSQFQGFGGSSTSDTSTAPRPQAVCAPTIPAGATPAERQAALAQASTCASAPTSSFNFSSVGFGAVNQWVGGLVFSQNVFAGGSIAGRNQAAAASTRAASIEVAAQRAQAALDVTQAYYDATLADRLVAIQESALQQTDEVLKQTRVARQVGNSAEFDLLRAQVTRDNQVPVLLQVQNNRQIAYLRLKQLLEIPLDDSLDLTTTLDDTSSVQSTVVSAVSSANVSRTSAIVPDTSVSDRAPVRELEQNVRAQEGLLRAARGQRLPQISITSAYQRLYFPSTFFPQLNNARQNWTIGVGATLPIFAGGRIHGDEVVAQGNLQESRARLKQTRELAALDTRVALSNLAQAEATWKASAGTADQALRAYNIDQIRYQEGISTQTDLTQTRLQLEQARANRAQAARDLAVARVRLALLKDLPLQAGGAGAAAQSQGTNGAAATPGGATPQQQQQRTTTQTTSTGGLAGGGVTP